MKREKAWHTDIMLRINFLRRWFFLVLVSVRERKMYKNEWNVGKFTLLPSFSLSKAKQHLVVVYCRYWSPLTRCKNLVGTTWNKRKSFLAEFKWDFRLVSITNFSLTQRRSPNAPNKKNLWFIFIYFAANIFFLKQPWCVSFLRCVRCSIAHNSL